MRNTNEQNIKDVIKSLFEGSKVESKLLEADLVNKWPEIVGDMIARNTKKMYIKNGRLYLQIESAPLRNELSYSRSRIVEIVNEHARMQLITEVVVY